jgi:allantoinase
MIADQFPMRRRGMDHARYDYSMLQQRPTFLWPGGKRVAVWLCVPVQFFPLNQQGKPFKVPGGMTTPFPDLRHYSLRDYGNRVGIYRMLDAIAASSLDASFALNAALVARTPTLVRELAQTGEILCHGMHMDALHFGGMDEATERAQIVEPAKILRDFTGQAVSGWLSPAKSQSENTPDLLAEAGFAYCADWINDELPYPLKTRSQKAGTTNLHALPLSTELEDRFVLMQNAHSAESWCQQVCDAFDFLVAESVNGARLLALQVHPWLIGQPHRIGYFEQVLAHISGSEHVYSAQPSAILQHALLV